MSVPPTLVPLDPPELLGNVILFISSNPFDIAGAKVFGYQVCWINRFDLQEEEFTDLDTKPDLMIKSLAELVGKL